MTNKPKVLIAVAVLAVIGIGYSATKSTDSIAPVTSDAITSEKELAQEETNTTEESETAEVEVAAKAQLENEPTGDSEEMELEVFSETEINATGEYLTYSPEAVASSKAEHIVLNFSATWCPSCRTLDKDINASLSEIPGDLEIYKVDYDTNIALRQKYGVTTQHTLVEINADGTAVNKWSGGSTLETILAKL